MNALNKTPNKSLYTIAYHAASTARRCGPLVLILVPILMGVAQAQTGFATSEITSPIKNLVTIANAAIAGLAILAVIYYAVRWIGGDEGAAKKIIGVIVVAVIALGAANFLGWVTGKSEFDTFTN